MTLDVQTLIVALAVTCSTLALALAAVAFRRSLDLQLWAWALGLDALAYLLFGLRGRVSDWLSVVLANAALAAGFSLFMEGILLFQGRHPRRWLVWLPLPLVALSFALLLHDLPARLLIAAGVFAAQGLACFWALLQRRRETVGRGQYILMSGFLLVVLIFVSRGLAVLAGNGAIDPSVAAHAQLVGFLGGVVGLMLLAIGLVLMAHERAGQALAEQQDLLASQHRALLEYSRELEQANDRLAELTVTDGLTGLANRRRFDEVLQAEWARARRCSRPLAVLMIDVDYFKNYNDHYGHLAGDECLRRVALALQRSARRASDLAARYGGEEFVVIASDTDLARAWALGTALCAAVADEAMSHECSGLGRVSVSIGIAVMEPDGQGCPEDLLREADAGLYRAKEGGRNRVAVAAEPPLAILRACPTT